MRILLSDIRDALAAPAMDRYETVTTDQIKAGDVLAMYGRVFLITAVHTYPNGEDMPADQSGPPRPVYVCYTQLMATTQQGVMPDSWAADWKVQGNWRATWARRVALLSHQAE